MRSYVDSIKPARISRERQRTPQAPLTMAEHMQLRSLTGALIWVSRCCAPEISFAVSDGCAKRS